jgi:hypothetical protein
MQPHAQAGAKYSPAPLLWLLFLLSLLLLLLLLLLLHYVYVCQHFKQLLFLPL